jgi:hypothetical protein
LPAVAARLTTNRRRYFIDGISCRIGPQDLPVVNLSPGGLFASADTPLLPGEAVEVELILPKAPLKMHGTVRWFNDGASTRDGRLPTGYGVELTDLDTPARNAILDFLRRSDPISGPPASW